MAHRQSSATGERGGGNQHPQMLYPMNTMQMHAQQQQQIQHHHHQQQQHHHHQQQPQQTRHRSGVGNDHQQQHVTHLPPPRLDSAPPDLQQHHRIDPHQGSRPPPPRINSNNKSCPYPPQTDLLWRNSIPTTFPHPSTIHAAFPPPQNEDHSIGRDREREVREEEARRAQEQVMKHFEDSFRFAQQKSSVQSRYQTPSQQSQPKPEEMKSRPSPQQGMIGTSRVPSPQNKSGYHNMAYATVSQTSPYPDMGCPIKKGISGPPPLTPPEYLRQEMERGYYATPAQHLTGIRPREPIPNPGPREIEKYTNNNPTGGSKGNFYGPPPPSARVKVSSPAPPQIYGKPSIPGSSSPSARNYDSESSPLSLTSKVSTRPTPTPPLPSLNSANLPKHEVRSADLTNYYMYSSASNGPPYAQSNTGPPRFSPKPEYQTQPLDLGGKRKIEPRPVELEIKKVKNEACPRMYSNPILNLVKGESGGVEHQTQTQSKASFSPMPSTVVETNLNGDEIRGIGTPTTKGTIEPKPDVVPVVRCGFTTPPPPLTQIGQTTETLPDSSGGLALSDNSPVKGNNTRHSNCFSPTLGMVIHKGKKVFLQRHSGQDGSVVLGMSEGTPPTDNNGTSRATESPSVTNSPERSNGMEIGSSSKTQSPKPRPRAEKTKDGTGVSNGHDSLSRKRQTASSDSEEGTKIPPKRPKAKGKQKVVEKISKEKRKSESETHSESEKDSVTSDSSSFKDKDSQANNNNNISTPVKKRGRKPVEGRSPSKAIKKSNPFKRPAIHRLKKTGESFLQDGPCNEVAPKLGKCRECRLNGPKTKKHSNIFCRFYAFRKLRYTKNGSLAIAGFSDPTHDPSLDDLKLWLPSKETRPKALELEMAKFLIDQLGDQFCELIHQEKEAIGMSMSPDKGLVAWKRVVQGVREMCDVCDTTLFNFHWACKKCGFVVCIACYRGRKQGVIKRSIEPGKERDEFQWLFCSNRQAHEIENLMLTQAVAGEALSALGDLLHKMRVAWNIPQECDCEDVKKLKVPKSQDPKSKSNEQNLPDVSGAISVTATEINKDISTREILTSQTETKPKKHTNDSEDEEGDDEGHSDLMGMLAVVRKSSDGGSASEEKEDGEVPVGSEKMHFNVPARSTPKKEKELKHFIRRHEAGIRREKEAPAVNSYSMCQTTKLFPGVPHSWLCYGKLLHLHDPLHQGNQRIFQEVWKRGQPVIVSHVSDRLNKSLWSPDSFAKDFSELKNDLVNCMTGRLLSNQPMKKFWEGFEQVGKRLKDEKGNPMLLKLKDWPPGEDFAEMLPSRFKDLMANLPLTDYTNRSGRLNLASRLPGNFVKPDLGPKMYIAYGSGTHLDKGTTNLHLDISDAVNLMVHVGVPKDVDNKEDHDAVQEAIEQSDVDGMTIDRVKEDGELPGALWHIYNARDADKIRDLLNKVALERGVALEPHHDPIHDQSWYLDKPLRQRLVEEYNVMGYPIVQFMGDAVFIPAGAPHQVRNLHNCIKIAEDFVSPENVSHCFHLTEEFRNLTETHSNHEDKLQIKNIIYHAVKDAVSVLHHSLVEQPPPVDSLVAVQQD